MQSSFPNIRHIRVFLETAQSGSVSLAAARCHLSQPAATQAIKQLELDFGTPLLIRRRKHAALTPSGALFAHRAANAMRHLNEGANAARRETGAKARASFETSVTAAQLRNLIAIANAGSFTVAAHALGLSQPTVHRTARSLEAVAGTPFFIARSSGVRLTPAAESFVRGAKLAQSEVQQSIAEISQELGRERGIFVLGSLPLARTTIVPKAIHAMVSRFDGFQIRVVEGRYTELIRSLREGDIDCLIGALRNPAPADDILQQPLFEDALAIVAHPTHPLAKRRNLQIEDTLSYPWIAPPKDTPAGQYLFDTLAIDERPNTPVRAVSSSMAVLRGVLAQGPYISVVSRHQIKIDEDLGVICTLDVALEGHLREIGLTYRNGWTPTPTQKHFIDYLRQLSASEANI
ncbi:LysR family transcriptional regulator [Planktotalea sp.]|uniref:LysR family transcriptional regulator n=1 Tax=Planktotalea sp. TaxID=2029877 RepID=UPI0025F0C9F6|nr:LysR family transcriptional regulator [Planktotalea sp.]